MRKSKKRRSIEVYEKYWKFTAAQTDIFGTKFNNCLNIIIRFIDKNKEKLQINAKEGKNFSKSELYKELQSQIVRISGFEGKDPTISARKVINQFVKIGFIQPLLIDYDPLVPKFLRENNKEKKRILFSKIFYENSSLASNVTTDRRDLKHVQFLLKTLHENGNLNKKDIVALMVTDITNFKAGYLTREDLNLQYNYAIESGFDERKYNQISHLISYLQQFVDLKYDKNEEIFWFADDPKIADKNFDETYTRDGIKHRIYKEELKEESKSIYREEVCYLEKKPYKTLIASHIKPLKVCLKEKKEDEAYDVNNGLLLSPTVDSYFDKMEISFTDDGSILIGKNVSQKVKEDFKNYKLDPEILNDERKRYLKYHRKKFREKNEQKR